MSTHHLAIWIDHHEAHLVRLAREGAEYETELLKAHDHHTHAKKGTGQRESLDHGFVERVVKAIQAADEVYLCGPATSKDEIVQHIEAHHAPLKARILAVEKADRMSDGELAARARKVLTQKDKMKGVLVGR